MEGLWSKRKVQNSNSCFKCKKDIEVGEEELVLCKHKGRIQEGIDPTTSLHYCLYCGEEQQRKEQQEKELKVKEKAKKIITELRQLDRKSTRLNSSHVKISYAVFCLK